MPAQRASSSLPSLFIKKTASVICFTRRTVHRGEARRKAPVIVSYWIFIIDSEITTCLAKKRKKKSHVLRKFSDWSFLREPLSSWLWDLFFCLFVWQRKCVCLQARHAPPESSFITTFFFYQTGDSSDNGDFEKTPCIIRKTNVIFHKQRGVVITKRRGLLLR